jgi:Zn-dependent metalloprotease
VEKIEEDLMTRLLAGLVAGTALAGNALAGTPQMDAVRGSVRSLTFEAAEAPRYQGSAEQAARNFLSEYRSLFNGGEQPVARGFAATADAGLQRDEGETPEVRTTRVDQTESVRFVRFQQQVDGLDVDGADVVVAVREDGTISSVQGGYAASGHEPALRGFASPVGISSTEAMDIAKQALAAEELAGYEASELMWWVDGDGGLVKAHRVDISATKPRGGSPTRCSSSDTRATRPPAPARSS